MTSPRTWNTSSDPAAATAAPIEPEDKLMAELADASFARSAATAAASPLLTPQPVAPLPVHAVDPDEDAVHAALQAGTIPTFADETGTAPAPPLPLDPTAEREAYAAFLTFIQQHRDAATTVTFLDPDDYAKGLI